MPAAFTPPRPADIRGPVPFLLWLVSRQRRRIALESLLGSAWTAGLALPPYLLARAVDDGLATGDRRALLTWTAAILATGAAGALLAAAQHRTTTLVRMDVTFRTARAVTEQTLRLGAALPQRVTAGEVVAVGMGDVRTIAQAMAVAGPGIGAVVAYAAVAGLLLRESVLLALVVVAGVPLVGVVVGPLLGRLHRAGDGYRTRQGALTAHLVDVVTGLPVLDGLGGKEVHAARYRRESAALRTEGQRVGAVASWVGALGSGLPALFLAAVTWLGARMVAEGSLTIGGLVAVFGYVAVLAVPMALLVSGGSRLARGLVAARRVTAFLALDAGPAPDGPGPDGPARLHDPVSGVVIEPGRLTVLTGARPADAAAVVERLGRFTASDATWGGVRLDTIATRSFRARVLVADHDADLFTDTLRATVAGRTGAGDDAVRAALHAAAADDVPDTLPDGLGTVLAGRGGSLSGGQRQRLRMARALCAAPEVLLAVEPTSAVDAHTEAVMARRLRAARAGLTTVVASTSPFVLAQADTVVHLVDGRAAAPGTHGAPAAGGRPGPSDRADRRVLAARGADRDGEAVR